MSLIRDQPHDHPLGNNVHHQSSTSFASQSSTSFASHRHHSPVIDIIRQSVIDIIRQSSTSFASQSSTSFASQSSTSFASQLSTSFVPSEICPSEVVDIFHQRIGTILQRVHKKPTILTQRNLIDLITAHRSSP